MFFTPPDPPDRYPRIYEPPPDPPPRPPRDRSELRRELWVLCMGMIAGYAAASISFLMDW